MLTSAIGKENVRKLSILRWKGKCEETSYTVDNEYNTLVSLESSVTCVTK
jgi:hypothetical protein